MLDTCNYLKYSQKIKKIILREITNPDLNGHLIGQELGISRMHLHRKIKVTTGKSISSYILHIRLEKAQERLLETDEQITSIAYRLGFKDASYFTRVFKKVINCTPSQFRIMWANQLIDTPSTNTEATSSSATVVKEKDNEVKGEAQTG